MPVRAQPKGRRPSLASQGGREQAPGAYDRSFLVTDQGKFEPQFADQRGRAPGRVGGERGQSDAGGRKLSGARAILRQLAEATRSPGAAKKQQDYSAFFDRAAFRERGGEGKTADRPFRRRAREDGREIEVGGDRSRLRWKRLGHGGGRPAVIGSHAVIMPLRAPAKTLRRRARGRGCSPAGWAGRALRTARRASPITQRAPRFA